MADCEEWKRILYFFKLKEPSYQNNKKITVTENRHTKINVCDLILIHTSNSVGHVSPSGKCNRMNDIQKTYNC
jgi:hypothetical protein